MKKNYINVQKKIKLASVSLPQVIEDKFSRLIDVRCPSLYSIEKDKLIR